MQYNISAGNANSTTHAAIQHPEFWHIPACRTWRWWKARRPWTRRACKCGTPRAYTICKFHGMRWPRWPTPPLEAGVEVVLHSSHNKMRHVTRCQCIPASSNGTQTGTFVSFVGLMSKMDIRPKHAQPPGDAQLIKRGTPMPTLGSILRRDMTRAPRQCTSHSSQPCDGVRQNS